MYICSIAVHLELAKHRMMAAGWDTGWTELYLESRNGRAALVRASGPSTLSWNILSATSIEVSSTAACWLAPVQFLFKRCQAVLTAAYLFLCATIKKHLIGLHSASEMHEQRRN